MNKRQILADPELSKIFLKADPNCNLTEILRRRLQQQTFQSIALELQDISQEFNKTAY